MGKVRPGSRRRKIKILLPWLSLLLFVPGLCLQEKSSGKPDEILNKTGDCAEELKSSDQEKPSQKIPRYDAAAVVKLVPVRVLDSNGRPVTDLKKEDFVLYDNKEQKKITEFEVHTLGEISRAPETAGIPASAGAILEKSRRFFILLDVQGSDANGMVNAKKAATNFVETQLGPDDEAAVFYYGPMTGLNMVQYLTSDKNKIKNAIERAKESPPMTMEDVGGANLNASEKEALGKWAEHQAEQERLQTAEGAAEGAIQITVVPSSGAVSSGASSGAIGGGGGFSHSVRPIGISPRSPQEFEVNMEELAKALQYIPGPKNVLLFSGRSAGKAIGLQFAASNTPVFTVNTKNWIIKGVAGMSGGVKEKYIYLEHPLKDLALASGAKYFADIEDVAAISDEIQTLTAHYYVLGYYINETWDGRFHRIDVDVKRPGCQVFVQGGYYGAKPFAQYSAIEKDLHLYGLLYGDRPASADIIETSVEALYGTDGKGSTGIVLAKLPVDEKTGLPPSKAELYTVIFDKDGKSVESSRTELDLAPHARKTLYAYTTLRLPAGEFECRFVGRDTATGRSIMGKATFKIPEPEPKGLTLFEPLLLVPGLDAVFLRLLPPRKTAVAAPSLADFFPLVPGHCAPLGKTLDINSRQLLAVIPTEFRGGAAPQVNLDFKLLASASGEEIPVEVNIVKSLKVGTSRVVLAVELDFPELGPGAYQLEITASDASGEFHKAVRTSFTKK
jgi:VWFA-related protein